MTLERKTRSIDEDVALQDLKRRGYEHLRPFEIVIGGLLGDAIVSKLFNADGLIWEFEEKPDGVRVYIYEVDDYIGSTNGKADTIQVT